MFYNLNTEEKTIEMHWKIFFLWEFDEKIYLKIKQTEWNFDDWKEIIKMQLWKYNDDFEIERVTEKDIINFIKIVKKWLEK